MSISADSDRQPPRGWYKRNEIAITPWLFLAPGALFFVVYVIAPIWQSFGMSLYDWNGLGDIDTNGTYVGLENYNKLFGLNGERADRNFQISLWNNLRWLVLYLLAVPLGLFIALFLNQNVRGIRLYKYLFFSLLSSVRLSSVWCFRGSICPITGCSQS